MASRWMTRLAAGFAVAASLAAAGAAVAQQPAAPEPSGRDVLVEKCFQCHQDNTWRDGHKSRREWEATLYRMVGRGALWTTAEINMMAAYLEEDYGPVSASTTSPPKQAPPK